ncbi:MAG: hypothetical protein IT379_12750 [Deltaproteobacteria bacterium]|nr:hypothetical protein [Deltaproteobacteria bacterium]
MSRPAPATLSVLAVAVALALTPFVLSCDDAPRTEIVVVVDSDLSAPGEIDRIEIDVVGPDEQTLSTGGDLADEPLPRSVGVVHEAGDLQPVEVRARGLLGGRLVVERVVRTGFVKDETVVLLVALLRSCAGVTCGGAQSCGEDGCASPDVAGVTLPSWTGTEPRIGDPPPPPRMDGGPRDAGPPPPPADSGPRDAGPGDASVPDAGPGLDACMPTTEACNMRDDDCDGMVDEDFDLTSADHCGACNAACRGMGRVCCPDGVCRRGGC